MILRLISRRRIFSFEVLVFLAPLPALCYTVIEDAVALYPNVTLIDRKGKIDSLIYTGVDYFSFCINDAHQHSTPLAGYVGAHMIYRAILNRIPTATSFDSVSRWELNFLGDYVTTGQVTLFDESSAYLMP